MLEVVEGCWRSSKGAGGLELVLEFLSVWWSRP